MHCPTCKSVNTRVTCTTHLEIHTKRYCRCLNCNQRFQTIERYLKYYRGPKRGSKLTDTQGVKNGNAVLTEQNILDIRRLKAEGKTNFAISLIYGINRGHVSRIVNRKVWSHV